MASGGNSPSEKKQLTRVVRTQGTASASSIPSNVSIQAQLELADIPAFANEPGPGHYFAEGSAGFSSLGDQILAKSQSAPKVSFAETGWKAWERVVVTKAHEATRRCRSNDAGHPYNIPDDGLGKISTKFGTSVRPDLSKQLGAGTGSPGPSYNVRYQPDGDVPNPEERLGHPKNKLAGVSDRFPAPRGVNKLGPGEYRNPNGLKLETGRSFGISRTAYDKVIMNDNWESEGLCVLSPGVGPPMWRDAKKDGSKACPFSKAERFAKVRGSDGPGPGQYRQSERDVSVALSSKRGCPLSMGKRAETFRFGNQPKKPRFRILLAQRTSERGAWGYF